MSIRASCLPGEGNTIKNSGCGRATRCGCVDRGAAPATPDATALRDEPHKRLTIDGPSDGRVKCYGYLDIETTGFSWQHCDLTVVGVAVVRAGVPRFGQLYGGQVNADSLLGLLEGVDEIYTYNGSRFDLPFIKSRIGLDLPKQFAHTDLMYNCWRKDLKGGLKAVEVRLGIARRLTDMNGFMAVRLWWNYVNDNDLDALQKLLEYNREDVMNLHILREKLGVK